MDSQVNKADGGKTNPLLLYQDLCEALQLVNRVLDYGAEKYERAGWMKVDPERYRAALIRHMNEDMRNGPADADNYDFFTDKESGLLQKAHLACNALFLLQLDINELLRDGVDMQFLCSYNKPPQNHKRRRGKRND